MKKTTISLNIALLSTVIGCASNTPFNQEQLAVINQNKIVVQSLATENEKPLSIYTKSGKVGSEVAQIALGILLGGYKSKSSGDTPRTRFQSASASQALMESGRGASGEKIVLKNPTQTIQELLTTKFDIIENKNNPSKDNLTITTKTVAWHLYYDKMLSEQSTYLLEYAADINMSLPNAKLQRSFPCDKQSQQALTKEEWLANEKLRIRTFADDVAKNCFQQILTELGQGSSIGKIE